MLRGARVAAITLLGLFTLAGFSPAQAAESGCKPGEVATKYPGLAGKTLKVTVTATTKPYSFRDPNNLDNIIGFGPDYARAAFACIGVPITFASADWSGLVASVSAGQSDLIWDALYYTPERAKSLDFVVYEAAGSGTLVPKGNPKQLSALSDLCGLRIVALIGSVEAVKAQEASAACQKAGKAEIAMTTAADRASGLRLVENDRVDAYLGEATVAAYDKTLFERAFSFSTGLKIAVGIAKGNKVLEQAVFDAIKSLQASGEEKAIYEKYGIDSSLSLPPEILVE
jgi:polar amino acid transport system substrate-binding protein